MSGSLQPQVQGWDTIGQDKPLNPFGGLDQALATGNKLVGLGTNILQNNQLAQQQKARAAMGPILQQSIDPATGKLDSAKAFVGMASHPDTAWMATDFYKQLSDVDKTVADTAKTNLETAKGQNEALLNAVTPFIADAKTTGMVSRDSLLPAVAQLVSGKVIPQGMALSFLQNRILPDDPNDPQKTLVNRQANAKAVQDMMLQAAGAGKAIDTVLGGIQLPNTGGAIQPTRVSPLFGAGPAGAPLVMTPPTSELNDPLKLKDNSGQETAVPRVQAAPMVDGAGRPINPGAGAPAVTALDPVSQDFLTKRVPEINQAAAVASTTLKAGQEIEKLQQEARTGPGGDFRNRLAAVADGLGLGPDLARALQGGKGNDPVAASQTLQKLMFIRSLDTLRTVTGNSREGQEIQNRIIDAIGSSELKPQALSAINALINFQADLAQKEQKAYNIWMSDKSHKAGDFPVNWQTYLSNKGIIPKLNELANKTALELGPAGKPTFKAQ